MSKEANRSAIQPPVVNLKGLRERKILQAELMRRDSQLQNFAALRERLTANGQDANAMYKKIEARRTKVAAELNRLTPAQTRRAGAAIPSAVRAGQSVLSLPIAAARFNDNVGLGSIFGFGYSGSVQMGRATEGINEVAQGKYPSSGDIYTVVLSDVGGITFDGDLNVGPDEANQFDPTEDYFWIHNWSYLIPFPAATFNSNFSYSFNVYVQAALNFAGGQGTLYSFISVGETANLQPGQQLAVDTDAGWPLVADLTQEQGYYNGHYGFLSGQATVQRSFEVGGGQTPGVVVGVICGLSMMSRVYLNFPGAGEGYITPNGAPENAPGVVNFHYQPTWAFAPVRQSGAEAL